MTKFTLLNPHVDDFVFAPPHFRFLRRRPLKKYGYISELPGLMFWVDGRASAFVPISVWARLPLIIRRVITKLELLAWSKINGINLSVRLDDEADRGERVLIGFGYKSLNGKLPFNSSRINQYRAVVFHLSHYHVDADVKAANAKAIYENNTSFYLAGDVDITGNRCFVEFYPFYNRTFVKWEFAVNRRFLESSFREPRVSGSVLATGTVHRFHREPQLSRYSAFMDQIGVTYLHELRHRFLGKSYNNLTNLISEYRDYSKPYWIRAIQVGQKKYFSVDLFSALHKSEFCLAGEEIIGFPSIVAIEALCAGSVVVGDARVYGGYPSFVSGNVLSTDCLTVKEGALTVDVSVDWSAVGSAVEPIRRYFSEERVVQRFTAEIRSLGVSAHESIKPK